MKKKIKVGVIGQGFVGGSLTTVLAEKGIDVYVYDKACIVKPGGIGRFSSASANGGYPSSIKDFVLRCELLKDFSNIFFVCVPTPMKKTGEADLSIVESVLQDISDTSNCNSIAVIKSTVPPGSTQKWNEKFENLGLHVIFNPEFLTEANALNDMRNQNRIILGGPRPWINKVKQIYSLAFPDVPLIKTSSTTAEMVKYVTNCFLATKVSFANEMFQICEALDKNGMNIDYDKVIEYAKHDKRLGDSHWMVPGPDGSFGSGGHCFPKDLNALMFLSMQLGIDAKVLNGTWAKNLEVRTNEERDWEQMKGRAVSYEKE